MSNDTRTVTGVAELCALPPVDKWQILDALNAAATEFGLNHRTLSVLRALLTFLPAREISAEMNSTIVFPSNRTLSERLHGMPESTLRRHLAKLVELGVIGRHDSANRKRFARRSADVAYGFDLSPLAVHADHIHATADALSAENAQRLALRDRINVLRRTLIEAGCYAETGPLAQCSKMLRRKLDVETLATLAEELETLYLTLGSPTVSTPNLSAKDSQNERHIQTQSKSNFDSEPNSSQNKETTQNEDSSILPDQLTQVLSHCCEYKTYFPNTPQNRSDLSAMTHRLVQMIGIEAPVYRQAEAEMGSDVAASTVLCMLERLPLISNPGGYLRRLSQRASKGLFSLEPMLSALRRTSELSADNFQVST